MSNPVLDIESLSCPGIVVSLELRFQRLCTLSLRNITYSLRSFANICGVLSGFGTQFYGGEVVNKALLINSRNHSPCRDPAMSSEYNPPTWSSPDSILTGFRGLSHSSIFIFNFFSIPFQGTFVGVRWRKPWLFCRRVLDSSLTMLNQI